MPVYSPVMARWRAEALERLPELRDAITSADSVMALWSDVTHAFERAYRADPPDESLIGRIYGYADWCVDAPRGDDAGRDPLSAVIVSFYEEIPTIKPARDDMPRWFKLSEVADNRTVFAYRIGDTGFDELVEHMKRNQRRYQPRRRRKP